MLNKVKQWWINYRSKPHTSIESEVGMSVFTLEQVENAYKLGYTDGKRDGLTIAREQATKSLKEILWEQNNQKRK